MKYNQYSYLSTRSEKILSELSQIGLPLSPQSDPKSNLETFARFIYFHYKDTDYPLSLLQATDTQDALAFFQSDTALTSEIFYRLILQLLGFIPNVDFTDLNDFINKVAFPVKFNPEDIIQNIYQTLLTRDRSGMILIDRLVSQGLLTVDNQFHFFNGKSLATFDTNQLIREVVYVETPVQTEKEGRYDLVKVNIIRPNFPGQIPTMMTASPYHNGTNDKASDNALHKMEGDLVVKEPHQITVEPISIPSYASRQSDCPISQAEESFSHTWTYPLNDYFLARGFASIYVAGIGTAWSDGFMTTGDYQQVESFKAVIDWLNGKAVAYTSHRRDKQVLADWSNGKVTTTGKSYLGTMSTALATTAVEGLEVIVAEAGISSWYDYYRENGLVSSPGGYPGEDLDSLTELTYSRNLWAGDALHHNQWYQSLLAEQVSHLDRETGDYNQFWHERNYRPHLDKIEADLIYVHGLQDWNVKPSQVYPVLQGLPEHINHHTFLHQGEHVYLHNWQSIDFRETLNTLLTEKLLGQSHHLDLPAIIWQDNHQEQTWKNLEQFHEERRKEFPLGHGQGIIENHYDEKDFKTYCQNFNLFKQDLFNNKAQQLTIDITLEDDFLINGLTELQLKVKSSVNHGLISAQLLDFGEKARHLDLPRPIELKAIDNGIHFSEEDLKELPYKKTPYRVITKGHLNLQNRSDLMTIETVEADEWLTITWALEPTIYQLKKGDQLRLVLYTTDFEHTIRDQKDYQLTIDLAESTLSLPLNLD